MRKAWDQYFMDHAFLVAQRGTCNRARVGCVLIKGNRIIASGYNGSPSGLPHCDDEGHLMRDGHCIRTVHAEENALLQCSRFGIASEGATAYVTHEPCVHCRKRMIQAGIVKVVYYNAYRNIDNHHFSGDIEWVHYCSEPPVPPRGN